MNTTKTVIEIADAINSAGDTYYGEKAKAWTGKGNYSRIYFGSDFVTIENNGEIHNRRPGKARALSIGGSAVSIVEKHA